VPQSCPDGRPCPPPCGTLRCSRWTSSSTSCSSRRPRRSTAGPWLRRSRAGASVTSTPGSGTETRTSSSWPTACTPPVASGCCSGASRTSLQRPGPASVRLSVATGGAGHRAADARADLLRPAPRPRALRAPRLRRAAGVRRRACHLAEPRRDRRLRAVHRPAGRLLLRAAVLPPGQGGELEAGALRDRGSCGRRAGLCAINRDGWWLPAVARRRACLYALLPVLWLLSRSSTHAVCG
jgi:hypothetical protein